MQLRQKYLKVISAVIAAGTVGASTLLGSSVANAANEPGRGAQQSDAAQAGSATVSERLAAIRDAVFVVIEPGPGGKAHDPNIQLTWGNRWANLGWGPRPGWGRPRWNNWRNGWPNWNNFWRNW